MKILKIGDKEYYLIPRSRKIIELTERLKAKNLNDLIFQGLNDGNIKILSELIKSFAETQEGKAAFTSINNVYDAIDEWKKENDTSYVELYKIIAEVINDEGFFKSKMTKEELESQLANPISYVNLQEIAVNTATKMMEQAAQEEFRGHKG